MRSIVIAFAAGATLAAGLGCAQSDDGEFAREAARIGRLEVELGNYAVSNAQSPQVQEFGRAMVRDHDAANQELTALAQRLGITLDEGLTAAQRSEAQDLMNKRGAEFDEAYVEAMVDGHQKAIDRFSEQAGQGRSEIDRWAAEKLPVLRQHLSHAQALAQSEQVSNR
jgi:putative membrane protein